MDEIKKLRNIVYVILISSTGNYSTYPDERVSVIKNKLRINY